MKVSRKSQYALLAIIELAVNHIKGEPVTLISEIAGKYEIPRKYLEQILLSLKNAGILEAKRGIGGGYSLGKPPENISLGDIIGSIEGPLTLFGEPDAGRAGSSGEFYSGLAEAMADLGETLSGIMDSVTLPSIIEKTTDIIEARNRILNYTI